MLSHPQEGKKVAVHLNLDSLIPREDFEFTRGDGSNAPVTQTIDIKNLEPDAFFYLALRKPDFQRETTEWDPQRVVGLIQTFIEGDLVPAVILWQNKELLFVIDGSHRLSALIAWVHDDYGDGELSQKFFNYSISEDAQKVADKTRELIKDSIGSYSDHQKAIKNPGDFGPDIVARARALGSRPLQLQWVRGDAAKAEDSFIRINRKAVNISPQELELIEKRKKPQTIAARAIKSRGTGHKYWSSFPVAAQRKIEELAGEVHDLLFAPALKYPLDSLALPPGGAVSYGPTLRMVYDFVAMAVGVISNEDDSDGQRTMEYLARCRRVMNLLLSRDSSSLGLHPAIYFYSWTGNQQPILLLTVLSLVIEWERSKKLVNFIERRKELEEFLFRNRTLVNQVVRKFGTKESGATHLRKFYQDVIGAIADGHGHDEITGVLKASNAYSYLQPDELPYDGVAPTRMSAQVRNGLIMRKLLETCPRCNICGGFIPHQSISVDHDERREDGGKTTKENTNLSHPFCNTGVKESRVAQQKKQQAF